MADALENIYSSRQRYVLLVVALGALAGLIFFGLAGYVSAFLGAGILCVALRPWFTALVYRWGWNPNFVVVAGLLLFTQAAHYPIGPLLDGFIGKFLACRSTFFEGFWLTLTELSVS